MRLEILKNRNFIHNSGKKMNPSNVSKIAAKSNWPKIIVVGFAIGMVQSISFIDISHATENPPPVPLGFRMEASNKVKETPPALPDKEIRDKGAMTKSNDLIVHSNESSSGPSGQMSVTIPNLLGMAKESATFQIGKSGLVVGQFFERNHETIPSGNVMGQIPVFGSEAKLESPVDIIISSGPSITIDSNKVSSVQKNLQGKPGTLKWINKPLGEALEEIESYSGIKFKAPSSIKEENINMEVHAETWKAAIKKLLRGYSSVEMSNSDGNIVSVWIMRDKAANNSMIMSASKKVNKASPTLASGRKTSGNATPSKLGEKKLNSETPEPNALFSKLESIKTWPPNKPLPSSFYEDAHLQAFLSANGIESANDLSESKNIKELKRAARKQLLLAKMRARANNRRVKK